jgi:hypothetical protein
MPQVTTNVQPTKVQDIFDVIADRDLQETPVLNMIKKGSPPENDQFQWVGDSPDAADNSGTADGQAWQNPASKGNRVWIYTQIHHRELNFGTGVIAEGNKVAGAPGGEYNYQAKKNARLAVKCIERILIGEQENVAGTDVVAAITRGLEKWIQTGAQALLPVDASCRPQAGQVKSFAFAAGAGGPGAEMVEDDLNNLMQKIWEQTGRKGNWDVPCTAAFKRKVSSWGATMVQSATSVPVRRFVSDGDSRTLQSVIDIYIGDCGQLNLHLHPQMRVDVTQRADALVLDMEYIQMRVRQMPKGQKLPKDGTRERGQIFFTFGLQVGNPRFCGKFETLAT